MTVSLRRYLARSNDYFLRDPIPVVVVLSWVHGDARDVIVVLAKKALRMVFRIVDDYHGRGRIYHLP